MKANDKGGCGLITKEHFDPITWLGALLDCSIASSNPTYEAHYCLHTAYMHEGGPASPDLTAAMSGPTSEPLKIHGRIDTQPWFVHKHLRSRPRSRYKPGSVRRL